MQDARHRMREAGYRIWAVGYRTWDAVRSLPHGAARGWGKAAHSKMHFPLRQLWAQPQEEA